MKWLTMLFLLCLLVTCAAAQSPPKPEQGPTPTAALPDRATIAAMLTVTHAEQLTAEHELAQQRSETITIWIQGGLLAVGVIYSFFAGFQWYEIRKQVKLAKDAAEQGREEFRSEQRPWLAPTGAQFGLRDDQSRVGTTITYKEVIWIENVPTIHLSFRNSGRTPALKVFAKWTYEIHDWAQPMPTAPISSSSLTPIGAVGSGIDLDVPVFIKAQEAQLRIREIFTGSYRLTLRGEITYCGSIERTEPYITKFCIVWMPHDNKFVISGPFNELT